MYEIESIFFNHAVFGEELLWRRWMEVRVL